HRSLLFRLENSEESGNRIVELINHPFLQRNDRVVGDGNVFWTDFRTTLGDIAVSDSVPTSQFADAVFGIERMQLKRCGIDQETRTDELIVLLVITQDMADILAKKTLNTLAKLLDAIDVFLFHTPRTVGS